VVPGVKYLKVEKNRAATKMADGLQFFLGRLWIRGHHQLHQPEQLVHRLTRHSTMPYGYCHYRVTIATCFMMQSAERMAIKQYNYRTRRCGLTLPEYPLGYLRKNFNNIFGMLHGDIY